MWAALRTPELLPARRRGGSFAVVVLLVPALNSARAVRVGGSARRRGGRMTPAAAPRTVNARALVGVPCGDGFARLAATVFVVIRRGGRLGIITVRVVDEILPGVGF